MSHIKDDVERVHIKVHQSDVGRNIEPEKCFMQKDKYKFTRNSIPNKVVQY